MIRAATGVLLVMGLLLGNPGFSADSKSKAPRPPKDDDTGKYAYQGVVEVEGVGADVLYSRAKAWVATAYKSANDVIQLDDQAAGRIIAKGNYQFVVTGSEAWINHTLMIETKEGRYRYTLTDFVFDNGYYSSPLEQERPLVGKRKKTFSTAISRSKETIAALEKAMTTTEEDW